MSESIWIQTYERLPFYQPPVDSTLFSRVTFAFTTTFAAYLVARCLRPPRPPRQVVRPKKNLQSSIDTNRAQDDTSAPSDSIASALAVLPIYRCTLLAVAMWQSVLIIYPGTQNPLVFKHEVEYPVNRWLITWNPLSAVLLNVIIISAWIRLRAFSELGQDFTFNLQKPERLYTGGLYAYVQHPSYTTGFIAVISSAAWFWRFDGVWATALPTVILQWQSYIYYSCFAMTVTACLLVIRQRTREEEDMLKRTFGKQWTDWAAKTARFLPGII